MTTTQTYTTIELLTPHGPEYRRVSTAPARKPADDEIPVIDLSTLDGDLAARQTLAAKVRSAAENTGFFYVCNHGIPEEVIQGALERAQQFFAQSLEEKEKISPGAPGMDMAMGSGYRGVSSTQINKTESKDHKESFALRYDPRFDPTHSTTATSSLIARDPAHFTDHDLIWKHTSTLPGFRDSTTDFYTRRLTLARKLIRVFALALNLDESYFDSVVTHPCADALSIHYPGATHPHPHDVPAGIGSHTDIQCFTLLWQDASGGLQVLSPTDEWLDAAPRAGTLVVNVGDFLQRLSNDRFRSTVHRVYNRTQASRFSMPFFMGFDAEAVCRVVPSCVGEDGERYAPISCGEWRAERFRLAAAAKGE